MRKKKCSLTISSTNYSACCVENNLNSFRKCVSSDQWQRRWNFFPPSLDPPLSVSIFLKLAVQRSVSTLQHKLLSNERLGKRYVEKDMITKNIYFDRQVIIIIRKDSCIWIFCWNKNPIYCWIIWVHDAAF